MQLTKAAVFVFAAVVLAQTAIASGTLTAVYLRCEDRVDPLGIGNPTPELSWQLQSTGSGLAYRGETQSAYEIQVGSAPGAADLWDSGIVPGNRTTGIIYNGQALTTGKQCYWQVQVYDGNGNASPWSTPAQWSMGLLSSTDWTAQWIGYDAAYNLTPSAATNDELFNTSGLSWIGFSGQTQEGGDYELALRKKVAIPAGEQVTNAVMALYADNVCTVYVNGQEMTNATMNGCHPGASAMRWEATAWINVTPWLHSGTNQLALDATSSDSQESAGVIGQLVLQFADGSVSNVPVDTSWTAATWPAGNWTQSNYNDSSWSAPSSGGTPWGTPSLNDIARVPVPFLRKDFVVPQAVTRATVYVTALGAYELRLNGQKVGNDVLTPGWTDFFKRVYYQTYDVTSMVQQGSNTLGAILGDGWYASVLAYKGQRLNYGGTPRFMAQLVVQLADGTTQTIVTDGSWMASYGPILYGDILLGSGYDARLEMPGWDTPDFDASAWSPVSTGLDAGAVGYTNVTSLVQSLEVNNQLNFVANNTTMGGDPAYGIAKTFQITYRLGAGTDQTKSFPENSTVSIGSAGMTLTVIQAIYGDASRFPGTGGLQVQAALTEPSRPLQTLSAVSMTEPEPGCYTFDLGQNMVGWVQLNISGSVGDRVTVRQGEMLNPDGTIYTANLRGATASDFYTFATNGTIVYQPRFTYHGFRYVELRGLSVPPTINSVTGIVVHSDLARTGSFACSDPRVNQLYSNLIWGQLGNYFEVPTDCPQRDERMGWTGDTEFFVPTAAYNFDIQSFFRRHLVTLCEDSQDPDGAFDNTAPNLGAGSGAAAWGDAGWICPYNMYRTYADTNVIVDHYASFQAYGQYLASYATNYTIPGLPGDFGDWVNLGGGASDLVIDTAFYAYYAQAMSEMAAAIGKNADAASYAALHTNIVSAFGKFFNSDGSFTDGSSQTGYALAVTLNLVPPSLQTQVAGQFANSIAQFGGHLATGFVGTPRLLPALHEIGRDDLAYSLLLQPAYPSWLYQVGLGATTMWERWDGWTPTAGFETVIMNSFNHYAFGSVGQYLYSVVGGINPASPGYRTILIQPVPGIGLTWANTSFNSDMGLISTAWTNTGGTFNLSVVIPPNTTAEVYVPTTNAAAITESGMPAADSPGVLFLGMTNNTAVYSVGSGNYFWSSPYFISTGPAIVITTTNETGSGAGTFYPTWTVQTNGSLIAGLTPVATSGNFSEEIAGRTVDALTLSNNLGLTQIHGPYGITTSTNYVTCGNGTGPDGSSAGNEIVYTLPSGSGNGYNLTNITVYGGWADNGRDQQAYTVYYSTVANPAAFIQLAVVNYTPQVPAGIQSATRVNITSTAGVLASGVAALKFDFSTPASENGYCGYAGITVFGAAVPAVNQTVTFQLGSGTGTFFPNWTVNTNGSLIAGQLPTDAVGDFSLETPGRSLAFLAISNNLGLAHIVGNPASQYPITTTTNYLTCGDGGGAGSLLVYTLNGPSGGYNLTNITVYGGWADSGRDQQAYAVYYSTTAAPTNFLFLGIVNFLPPDPAGVQCATRVTLASESGVLASNVAAVKFDFTTPPSTNGYCGYAAITMFGTPVVAQPLVAQCALLSGQGGVVISFDGLQSGGSYALQSTTNLLSPVWITETNFIAAQSSASFTNAGALDRQKFYRVVAE